MPSLSRTLLRRNRQFLPRRFFASHAPTITDEPPCDVVQGPSLLRTSVHRPQPSLLSLTGLRSLPLWTQFDGTTNRVAYQDPQLTEAVDLLQDHVDAIRNEYQRVATGLRSDYQTDTEHTLHEGVWDWHSYMTKGQIQTEFQNHFGTTSHILQQLRDSGQLFEGTPFGYCFFSTLHGNSKIQAHTAPMNFRLRIHLPLVVPKESDKNGQELACGIRVGPISSPWTEGQALVLDDAYQHEVWNMTTEKRVLLLVDVWHPDVTRQERRDIVATFQHAADQGWWKKKE